MPIGVRVVKEEVFAAWSDAMKEAAAAGTAAAAEKDKEKRKQILQQKKELLEKAKGIVKQAALEQAGARQFAKADATQAAATK
jgi:cytochrome c oxidase subunit 2